MSANKSLLIVDSDTRSLRVLEVSLRKAGFAVATAHSSEEAWRAATEAPPDLLITDTQLPDETGFDLCARHRGDPRTRQAAIVFLSAEATPDIKIRAIEAGADDFLAKPVLVKEIIERLRAILARREDEGATGRERDGHLRGTLANMGVVDIVQVMEAGSKSGVVHLSSDAARSGGYVTRGEARATLYFREGQLVDAQLAALSGAEALYRTLLWEDGDFEIELVPIERPDLVQTTTPMLLLEGMRRLDEWSRLSARLPRWESTITVDYVALGRRFAEVPGQVRSVVHLFDGERTLFEVIDASPVDDATAVSIVTRLLDEGVLQVDEATAAPEGSSIEAWLSGAGDAEDLDVPSALGHAVIPSPHSPSEILAAADPTRVDPSPEPSSGQEEQTGQLRRPSIVLSRHTVPANRGGTATPVRPPRSTEVSHPPRLSIQRVSSIIHPASPLPEDGPPTADGLAESEVTASTRSPFRGVRSSSRPMSTVGGAGMVWSAPEPSPPLNDAVPRGAVPSDEPSLVLAPRPAFEGRNGRAIDPGERGTPGAAFEPIGDAGDSSELQTASNLTAVRRGAPAEEDFFSGEAPAASEPQVDWGESSPRSLVERIAPVAVIAVILLFIGVVFGPGLLSEKEVPETDPDAQAQAAAEQAMRAEFVAPQTSETPATEPTEPEGVEDGPKPSAREPSVEKVAKVSTPPQAAAPESVRLPSRAREVPRSGAVASALRDAESALRDRDLAAAKSRFQGAIRLDAQSAAAHSGLAYTFLAEENIEAARRQAFRALRLDKSDARANLVLGTIAQNEGKLQNACRRYRRYLDLGGGPMANEIRSIVGQSCRG